MGRLLKFALIAVGGLVALVVIAAVGFLLFFDPNDFRDDIAAQVRERTGRELAIEGDLKVSLFPWLAIEIGKTRLGQAPGFGDDSFASFESARLSVRLMPLLLRREVTIGTAALDTLDLKLAVRRDGTTNWQDLAELGGDEDEAEADEPGGLAALDVASIDIRNSSVTYANAQTKETYRLTNLAMQSGRVSGRDPVPLTAGFAFEKKPDDLKGEVELDTVVTFDTDASTILFENFEIDGVVEGLADTPTTLAVRTKSIEINTAESRLTPAPIEATVLGVDLEADFQPFSYAGDLDAQGTLAIDAFSPRSLMQRLDIEVPETADPNALGKAIVDGKVRVLEERINLSDMKLTLDETTFTGSLSIPRATGGIYRFALDGNSIDVNRYMAPAAEGDGEAAKGDEPPVEIPVDLIRSVNAHGKLTVSEALLGGMRFEGVELNLRVQNGDLRLHPVSAKLFGGTYSGDVRIDARGKTPTLSVDEKVSNVSLTPLAEAMFQRDNITGAINGAFKLSGRGADLAEVQRSLNGNMSFELTDGVWEGTDLWYELRRARALLKREAPPEPSKPPRTRFSSVKASGPVADGVFRNSDLRADVPYMQLTGNGAVDLAAATVDYRLTARVLERPEFATDATEAELKEFTEAVIPMKITGPLAAPKIQPDIEQMLTAKVKEKVEEKIEEKILGRLLGGREKEPAPAEAAEAPPEGEAAPAEPPPAEEKKDIEDEVKDRLKDLLKR